jgi:hypothetical protein
LYHSAGWQKLQGLTAFPGWEEIPEDFSDCNKYFTLGRYNTKYFFLQKDTEKKRGHFLWQDNRIWEPAASKS